MTDAIAFFDRHNDLLLRLLMSSDPREETWLGATGNCHLDLGRMRQAGFAGGLFAIFVPPVSSGPPPRFRRPDGRTALRLVLAAADVA